MTRTRRIDVVHLNGAWSGVDDHGVVVVIEVCRADAVATVSNAGTGDLPITVAVHREDGSVESERVFPSVLDGP